jgi:hypothetical protein
VVAGSEITPPLPLFSPPRVMTGHERAHQVNDRNPKRSSVNGSNRAPKLQSADRPLAAGVDTLTSMGSFTALLQLFERADDLMEMTSRWRSPMRAASLKGFRDDQYCSRCAVRRNQSSRHPYLPASPMSVKGAQAAGSAASSVALSRMAREAWRRA